MSLSKEDLTEIRKLIVEGTMEAVNAVVNPRFDRIETDIAEVKEDVRVLKEDMREAKEDIRTLQGDVREIKVSLNRLDGRLEAVEADVKELYRMVRAQSKQPGSDKRFAKLSVEQKILQTYEDVKLLAREAGVTLPS